MLHLCIYAEAIGIISILVLCNKLITHQSIFNKVFPLCKMTLCKHTVHFATEKTTLQTNHDSTVNILRIKSNLVK